MSAKRPVNITIKRLQGDTYAEKWSVDPMPATATSVTLSVEGLGDSVGVVDLVAKTVELPVSAPIANGAVGSFDYEVVLTAGGTTRTIVVGTWIIIARPVTP